jgi:hypothetical protein
MTNEQASQFVSALFKETFDAFDRTKVDKFFSQDMTGFLLSQPINIDGVHGWIDRLEASYTSLESMVHQTIVEGRKIAAVVNLSLLEKDNHKKIYVSIAIFIELGQRGKIIKWRSFTSG